VEQLAAGQRLVVTPGTGIRTRVTLTAVNQDVRTLLPALAAASGVNLVMGPDVRGTVTVHLVDVPADEALRSVIAAAGLSIDNPAALRPWGPTVFQQPPLNINTATVEEIKARFNVSTRVAETIIAARPR
jgi:protein transport protein HofQ